VTRVLLCDADGCLFPSEEPAFVASAEVTNRLLAELGIDRRFAPEELKAYAVGKNFRATALELAAAHGATLTQADLEPWVDEERRAVIAHLGDVLRPDPQVIEPLTELAGRCELAVVSSSALARLDACFEATGLAGLFPPAVRFSAEDSLPVPTSKPDPAVYVHAGERLGVGGDEALAIEDSVTGARSAIAAGFPTLGNVLFVPEGERDARTAALRDAGVEAIVASWREVSRRSRSSSAPAARTPAR
jgi:beta-phosphoglucomutase-like phosphatase (HAD superfamily)